MKRLGWILAFLMAASPVWAARKVSVQQLKDLLVSLHQASKTDTEVAAALEQVELSEQLNRSTMNELSNYIPGPFSTEQFYVLEAQSAVLAPPSAELPTAPAPDAATQKAILDKAADYAAKTYGQLPHLTAIRNTIRFQNNLPSTHGGPDAHPKGADPNLVSADQVVHYIGSVESPLESENGGEKISAGKGKPQPGQPGQITLLGQGPVLGSILLEAQAAGKLSWQRWQTVNNTQAAVFSFTVEKKKSHYAVNYCCFPAREGAATGMSYGNYGARAGTMSDPGSTQPSLAGTSQAMPVTMQGPGAAEWTNFQETVPYHGELFVDPATGVVLRLVTKADFRSFEIVKQEDQRIDYGPVTVGGKTLVLPVKSFIDTLVVPDGYLGFGKHPTCRTMFTVDYKNYQVAGVANAEQK
jgi:hypothetical protein